MVIAMIDVYNDCSFAIKIMDDTVKEKVKEFMEKGLSAWNCATHSEDYEEDLFTKEEIEGFYWSGYAEPTYELLERNDIKGERIDIEYDEDGCVTNADEVFYY